jgi:phosphate transport system permease protein
VLTVAIVLAVMILPIITALAREVFLQTPRLHEEAALALGATRWEMIRMAVLPFGRPGLISATMLGLGRALGETMAVAMVLSPSVIISFALLTSQNPTTIAANIALNFPEASGIGVNVLIATGLILFLITLLVNSLARFIINRRKEFSGAN